MIDFVYIGSGDKPWRVRTNPKGRLKLMILRDNPKRWEEFMGLHMDDLQKCGGVVPDDLRGEYEHGLPFLT